MYIIFSTLIFIIIFSYFLFFFRFLFYLSTFSFSIFIFFDSGIIQFIWLFFCSIFWLNNALVWSVVPSTYLFLNFSLDIAPAFKVEVLFLHFLKEDKILKGLARFWIISCFKFFLTLLWLALFIINNKYPFF